MKPYYDHAGIAIYHGDCREVLPALALVGAALVTDPPYGIGFAAQPTKWQRRAGQKPEAWDNDRPDEVVARLVSEHENALVWGGNYFGLPPTNAWLCWLKPDAPPSMGAFDLAWRSKGLPRHLVCSISATNQERLWHPTQKPRKVMSWSLSFVPSDALVLDPYMGSGTTLRAAKDLGRRAVGIEIEERYCEMAAKRLSQCVLPMMGGTDV